jgi:hypothetical protein
MPSPASLEPVVIRRVVYDFGRPTPDPLIAHRVILFPMLHAQMRHASPG